MAIYILGINGSHHSSAALLKDGEVISTALEENFTKIKGQAGFPKKAIKYCLSKAKITTNDLDKVVLGFKNPTLFISDKKYQKGTIHQFLSNLKSLVRKPVNSLSKIHPIFYDIYELRQKTPIWKLLDSQQKYFLARQLKLDPAKIYFLDHHTAHAYAAYYSHPSNPHNHSLVITLDGEGDGVSSRVFIVKNHLFKQIASTPQKHSLGWLYEYVTAYFGMQPNQDEFKVMSLSLSAKKDQTDQVYQIFKQMMWVEGLTIKSKIPRVSYPMFLKKNLSGFSLHAIAGGIQKLTEELIIKLTVNAIKKTGISNIYLGGGVFKNTKAIKKIAKLPKVKHLHVCPSPTDDSTALGAAFYGYSHL